MRRLVTAMMMLTLVLSAIVLVARLVSPAIASAPAPLPPDHPVSHSAARSADESTQEMLPPPSPHEASREIQEARARSAIEEVFQKHSRYWGPRYQVEPVQVSVDGEWAHGVAQWQGEAKAMGGSVHVLARRSESGAWQALMPSAEGLYLRWVDELPESLVPSGEKSELQVQASKAARSSGQSQVHPLAVSAIADTVSSASSTQRESQAGSLTSENPTATSTPSPVVRQLPDERSMQPEADWKVYSNRGLGYQLKYPPTMFYREWSPAEDVLHSVSFYLMKESNALPYQTPEIAVSVFANPQGLTLEEWSKAYSSQSGAYLKTASVGTSSDLGNRTTTTIGGLQALVFEEGLGYVQARRSVLARQQTIFSISFTDFGNGELAPVYHAVLSTLEWSPLVPEEAAPPPRSHEEEKTDSSPLEIGQQLPLASSSLGYLLPWTAGETYRVAQGWGGSTHTCPGQMCYAYDFDSGVTSFEGVTLRASEAGTVAFIKSDISPDTCGGYDYKHLANYVTIYHPDGKATLYLHLRQVSIGSGSVGQGDAVGLAGKTGWTGCHPHLHFQRQNQGVWIADSVPVYFDEYSGAQLYYEDWVTSGNGGGTCPPPNLVSPDWGYVHPDDTVTFRWDPVDCPDQNGYLLRIGTSPDGSDVVSDRLSLGIQTNVTIGSQWHNRHLYWSVRANASGAPWSGSRRFRIELSSGGDCPLFNKGDANCDGCIDELDYVFWWKSYKKDVRADFNGDGITDDLDYVIWWKNFGEGCQGG